MSIIKNLIVAGTVLLLTMNLLHVFITPTLQPGTDSAVQINNLDVNTHGAAPYHDDESGYDSKEPKDSFQSQATSSSGICQEIDISFDFTVENVLRGGREYRRVSVNGGGIECGMQGEERPFFQHSLTVPGNIDQLTVKLLDPHVVQAEPTPYLVPQILGSDREILALGWQGMLEKTVEAMWTINHLSQTTDSSGIKELYSLKINPVEFGPSGDCRSFHGAKIRYSISDNHRRSETLKEYGPEGPVKYLIITSPGLAEAVRPLAEWKSHKGLFARIATTDEIDGNYSSGDLPHKMRTYIQEMESTYDLDYLLLVGDWDTVPTRTTVNSYPASTYGEPSTFATDHYFACVDPNTTWDDDEDGEYAEENDIEDAIPDMANGRLAVNSPVVLSSIIEDLLDRERNMTWSSAMEDLVYVCGDPSPVPGDPKTLMDYFWTQYGQGTFSGKETLYWDNSGTLTFSTNSFKQMIDGDYQAMSYFSHGNADSFPDLFANSDVSQLAENGMDGSFFAMACLTGWFDDPNQGSLGAVDNCLGEMLTETPKKGLAGYMGACRLAVGEIDTTYSGDAPGLEEDYWRAVEMAVDGDIRPTVGNVWKETITHFASSFYPFPSTGWDNPSLRTYLEYNLLGEPDAPLIFREPEELQLQFEVSPDNTSLWARVTNSTGIPVESASVTIYRYDELGRTSLTDSSGEVTILIPPNNGGWINITASRTGDRPANDTFLLADNRPPDPRYSISPPTPDGNNGYYVSIPTITLYGNEPVDIEYHWDGDSVNISETEAVLTAPDGNHTLNFRMGDGGGCWSDWIHLSIKVDFMPPDLVIMTDPDQPNGKLGWYIVQPTVSLNSTETLNSTFYRVDNGGELEYVSPFPVSEGIHDIFFRADDLAGNNNTTITTIKVDTLAPVSFLEASHPPDGANDFYVTPPTIGIKCTPEPTARFEYRWDSGNWTDYLGAFIPEEGTHILFYRSMDVVGNVETERNRTFRVDTIGPILNIGVSPVIPDGENGFYITSPMVNISASEGDVLYSVVPADEDFNWVENVRVLKGNITIPHGSWTLYAKAADEAGNTVFAAPMDFKVDTIPPIMLWETVPSVPDGEGDWYRSPPRLKISFISSNTTSYWCESNESDWRILTGDITLENGMHKIKFKVVDDAGNILNEETDWIKVDEAVPQVWIDHPAEGSTVGSSGLIEWNGADNISGMDRYEIKLDEKAWAKVGNGTDMKFGELHDGTHAINLRGYDKAGNNFLLSRTFRVDATAPIVVFHTPPGDNISVDSNIIITFSEEMDRDSVSIWVSGVEGEITWDRNKAAFSPDSSLMYSTEYNVNVTGSDLYNNSMENCCWSFITKKEVTDDKTTSMSSFQGGILIGIIIIGLIAAGAYIFVKRRGKSSGEERKGITYLFHEDRRPGKRTGSDDDSRQPRPGRRRPDRRRRRRRPPVKYIGRSYGRERRSREYGGRRTGAGWRKDDGRRKKRGTRGWDEHEDEEIVFFGVDEGGHRDERRKTDERSQRGRYYEEEDGEDWTDEYDIDYGDAYIGWDEPEEEEFEEDEYGFECHDCGALLCEGDDICRECGIDFDEDDGYDEEEDREEYGGDEYDDEDNGNEDEYNEGHEDDYYENGGKTERKGGRYHVEYDENLIDFDDGYTDWDDEYY